MVIFSVPVSPIKRECIKAMVVVAIIMLAVQVFTTDLEDHIQPPTIDTPYYVLAIVCGATYFSYLLYGPPVTIPIVTGVALLLMFVMKQLGYPGMIVQIERYAATSAVGSMVAEQQMKKQTNKLII
jgi:hypothetical protein